MDALEAETGLPIRRNRSTTAAGRALLRGVHRDVRRKWEVERLEVPKKGGGEGERGAGFFFGRGRVRGGLRFSFGPGQGERVMG